MKKLSVIIVILFLSNMLYAEDYIRKVPSAYSFTPILDGRYVKTNNSGAYNSYTWPNTDGSSGQVLKTDGLGLLTWSADTSGGGGGGGSSNWQWDAPNGWLEPITANTVISVGRVSGNTVYADNSIGTLGTATGNTVSGATVRNNTTMMSDYNTIQFTITSPDQLSETSKLLVWENNSGKTFNINRISAWSSSPYDLNMYKMEGKGIYAGQLLSIGINANEYTASTGVYVVSHDTVSWSTVTNSTVIYFDPSSQVTNYIKVSIRGYYS